MKKNFLSKISKIILSKYKGDLSDLVIVFPSRRASLFFADQLSKEISRPIWLPPFYSIDDFIFTITKLTRVNKLELFFEFYNIYVNSVESPHNLEKCHRWADMLLNDFDEIDRSLAHTKDIFNYLSDVKRIENWHLELEKNQEDIESYLAFYKSLNTIYNLLRQKLLSKSIAYNGLAQRLITEDLDSIKSWLKEKDKKRIIFIGLDALTISQETLIDYLLNENLCEIFWDSDEYFINNSEQESGKFLRKYQKKWPGILSKTNNDFLNLKKSIKIIGATKNINQGKLLASFLKKKAFSQNELKKVAIILPDEDLLLPVLESIPIEINDINVTMGYKLSNHPIISIFNDVLNLYLNARTISVKHSSLQKHFNTKDIFNLLLNPYLKLIIGPELIDINQFIQSFNKASLNYLSYHELKSVLSIVPNSIFDKILLGVLKKHDEILDLFQVLLNRLLDVDRDTSEEEVFLEECLYSIQEHLYIFRKFLSNINYNIEMKLFSKFFNQIINSIKINFSGEPLNGLQIMGLLEARTIDFDHVFILSANENNLPPTVHNNSFIPFDIKLKFGIRTSVDLDAIYANNFFNLIKRAPHTYVIYNQDYSSYSSSERSRFVNQLVYEIKPLSNTRISITEETSMSTFALENHNNNTILQQKDSYLFQKLTDLLSRGLSASTLNLYNLCPRQFYYEKIIGVSQIEELSVHMNSATVGLITHRALELLYQPYINKLLTIDDMQNIYQNIDTIINQAFSQNNIDNISRGKNFLAFEAIKRIITSYIKSELDLVKNGNQITIKFLEKSFSGSIQFANNFLNKTTPINLKGNIDRVDIFNDQYRIIDYKTGFVSSSELKTDSLLDLILKPKLLQLFMYSWLLKKQSNFRKISVTAGIINLRATTFQLQNAVINNSELIDNSILVAFEKEVLNMISNMFDPQETFEHLNKERPCYFCD